LGRIEDRGGPEKGERVGRFGKNKPDALGKPADAWPIFYDHKRGRQSLHKKEKGDEEKNREKVERTRGNKKGGRQKKTKVKHFQLVMV